MIFTATALQAAHLSSMEAATDRMERMMRRKATDSRFILLFFLILRIVPLCPWLLSHADRPGERYGFNPSLDPGWYAIGGHRVQSVRTIRFEEKLVLIIKKFNL